MKPQKSPDALEITITNSASTHHWGGEMEGESQSHGKEDSAA